MQAIHSLQLRIADADVERHVAHRSTQRDFSRLLNPGIPPKESSLHFFKEKSLMPAGTARGQTSHGAAASTGLPHRQPRGYGEPPTIDLDETLNLIEIHLVVVFEDLEGHASGLRRAREGGDVRNVRLDSARIGRGLGRERSP